VRGALRLRETNEHIGVKGSSATFASANSGRKDRLGNIAWSPPSPLPPYSPTHSLICAIIDTNGDARVRQGRFGLGLQAECARTRKSTGKTKLATLTSTLSQPNIG
jgi:hypothetical protein